MATSIKDLTFERLRQKQQHIALKQKLAASNRRRDRHIADRAVLQYRKRQVLEALERQPVRSLGRFAPSDSSQHFLQRQLQLMDHELAKLEQALRLEQRQLRQIIQELWQLSLQVRLKQQQTNHRPPSAPARQSDPLTGHVVPSYKLPNPLKDLRQQPQKRFGTVLLPWASLGLLLEIAIAIVLDLALLAAMGLILLLGLWLLVAIVEGLKTS